MIAILAKSNICYFESCTHSKVHSINLMQNCLDFCQNFLFLINSEFCQNLWQFNTGVFNKNRILWNVFKNRLNLQIRKSSRKSPRSRRHQIVLQGERARIRHTRERRGKSICPHIWVKKIHPCVVLFVSFS